MPNVPIDSDEQWHALRAQNIGSSDQPALWGVSPYKTLFQLYHEKRGTLPPPDLSDNPRVVFGRELERGIAYGLAQLFGLRIRKVRRYITHPSVPRMGASLDYEVATEDAGWVPLEVKNVDFVVWRDQWLHDGDGHEPPEHIDIQVQHQISCTEAPYAFIGVLVGGNTPHLIRRDRHNGVCAAVKAKVSEFWRSIDAGEEPAPSYSDDLDALEAVRLACDGSTADRRGDAVLEELIAEYAAAKAEENAAAERAAHCRGRALDLAGEAEKLILLGGSITAKLEPAKPERTVVYKATEARRSIRIYPKRARALEAA